MTGQDGSRGRLRRTIMAVLLLLGLATVAAIILKLGPQLATLQSDLNELYAAIDMARDWRDSRPLLAALLFLAVFTVGGLLPLPVVTLLTLAGGAFFGFWQGTLLSVAGTTTSATLGFLIARHVVNRPLRRWLGPRAEALDRAVKRNGTFALLSLRLTPALPFLVVNLAAGVSRMSLAVFAPITALGVLPNKAILSLAGTSLAEIDQISDIWGMRLVAILAALAALPWVARWVMARLGHSGTQIR